MSINKMDNYPIYDSPTSVYKLNGYSLQELLSQFFKHINDVIELVNKNEIDIRNFKDEVNKRMEAQDIKLEEMNEWLRGEGLVEEVKKNILIMYEDGRLADLINVTIFGELNDKIDGNIVNTNKNTTDITNIKSDITEVNHRIKSLFDSIPNWATPEEYGAIGDGATDDTEALRLCFENNNNIMLTGKYLSKGTNQLTGRKNVNIISLTHAQLVNGVADDRAQQEATSYVGISLDNCENVKIEGIHFEMNFYGIRIRNSKNITVRNCSYHTYRFANYMYGVDMVIMENLFVDNDRTEDFKWNDGIHVNGWAKNLHFTNIYGTADDDLIAITPSEATWQTGSGDIENVFIDGVYTYGKVNNELMVKENATMRPIRFNPTLQGHKVKNVTISNCYLTSDRNECVFFNGTGSAYSVIENVTFIDCYFFQNQPTKRGPLIGMNGVELKSLKFVRCTFRRNKASYFPAFISTVSGSNGVITETSGVKLGTLEIDDCSFINESDSHIAILHHGAISTIGRVEVRNCVYDNKVVGDVFILNGPVNTLELNNNRFNGLGGVSCVVNVTGSYVSNVITNDNIVGNYRNFIKLTNTGQINNIIECGSKLNQCITSVNLSGTVDVEGLVITQNNLIYDNMIDSNDESVVVLKGGNVRFKDVVLASHIPANFKPGDRFVHKDKTLDKYTMKIANSLGWQ